MSDISFSIRSYTLDPGEEVTISRQSDFLICTEASGVFKISFDDASNWSDYKEGLSLKPLTGFKKVTIYNDTATAISVELGFGKGDIQDASLYLSGSITNREEVPDKITSAGPHVFTGVQSALLFAADSLAKERFLKNDGASRVWINQYSGVAGVGWPLDPGEGKVLETTDDIYGHSEGATEVARQTIGWSS